MRTLRFFGIVTGVALVLSGCVPQGQQEPAPHKPVVVKPLKPINPKYTPPKSSQVKLPPGGVKVPHPKPNIKPLPPAAKKTGNYGKGYPNTPRPITPKL